MKFLLHHSKSLDGQWSSNLNEHMKFLEDNYFRNNEVFSLKPSKKFKSVFDKPTWNGRIEKITSVGLTIEQKPWQTWKQVCEANVADLSGIDHVIVLGGVFISEKAVNGPDYLEKIWLGRQGIGFQSLCRELFPQLVLMHSCQVHGVPFHHIVWDPLEANTTGTSAIDDNLVRMYWAYDSSSRGYKRLDSFQYGLKALETIFDDHSDKTLDFVFGMSAFDIPRELIYDELARSGIFQIPNSKFRVKHKRLGLDDTLPRPQYLEELSSARFTLMVPSYDQEFFSFYRFAEALSRDCLPLIHPACKTEEFFSSYEIDREILSPLLLSNDLDIRDRVGLRAEETRLQLLQYLKSKVFVIDRGLEL